MFGVMPISTSEARELVKEARELEGAQLIKVGRAPVSSIEPAEQDTVTPIESAPKPEPATSKTRRFNQRLR